MKAAFFNGDAAMMLADSPAPEPGSEDVVILGGFRRPITLDWLPPLLNEQSILFSSCHGILNGQHDYELAIDMLASGKATLQPMVTHVFSLNEIQQGFDAAYDKTTGSIKVQIHQAP